MRAGEVPFPCLFYFLPPSLPPFPLLSRPHKHAARAHQPHHYVSHLTGPVPRLGLTAQPGRALQSERVMLTVIFLDGAGSLFGGIVICKSRSHACARRARACHAASTVNWLDFHDDANFKLSAFCSVATQIVETQHKQGVTCTCTCRSPVHFNLICKARFIETHSGRKNCLYQEETSSRTPILFDLEE